MRPHFTCRCRSRARCSLTCFGDSFVEVLPAVILPRVVLLRRSATWIFLRLRLKALRLVRVPGLLVALVAPFVASLFCYTVLLRLRFDNLGLLFGTEVPKLTASRLHEDNQHQGRAHEAHGSENGRAQPALTLEQVEVEQALSNDTQGCPDGAAKLVQSVGR